MYNLPHFQAPSVCIKIICFHKQVYYHIYNDNELLDGLKYSDTINQQTPASLYQTRGRVQREQVRLALATELECTLKCLLFDVIWLK